MLVRRERDQVVHEVWSLRQCAWRHPPGVDALVPVGVGQEGDDGPWLDSSRRPGCAASGGPADCGGADTRAPEGEARGLVHILAVDLVLEYANPWAASRAPEGEACAVEWFCNILVVAIVQEVGSPEGDVRSANEETAVA